MIDRLKTGALWTFKNRFGAGNTANPQKPHSPPFHLLHTPTLTDDKIQSHSQTKSDRQSKDEEGNRGIFVWLLWKGDEATRDTATPELLLSAAHLELPLQQQPHIHPSSAGSV